MNSNKIKPISFSFQVKNFTLILILSLLISSLVYTGLILGQIDKNIAALIAFIVLIIVQILAEIRQYKRLSQDTDFLKNLTDEIPHLITELTELSRRMAYRRQQLTQRLDALAGTLAKLYRDKEVLTAKGLKAKRELQRNNEMIEKVRGQEKTLEQEKKELTVLLEEIDKQTQELLVLRDNSRDVIREMIGRLRVDVIKKLEKNVEELRQQQNALKDRGSQLVGMPIGA